MKAQFVLRVRLLSALFVLAAVFLLIRLYFIQIVHGDGYRDEAVGQYVNDAPDVYDRGDIFFTLRDGSEVAAAVMQSGWRVAIQPKVMEGATTTYARLNAILPIDEKRFFTSAAKQSDPYEEVAFRVSDDVADQIREAKIPAVLVVRDQWRSYPAEALAGQTIGFVGYRGDERAGVYGLERYYEDTLKRTGTELYVNPFAEIFTNIAAVIAGGPAEHQGVLVTTIDPNVQAQLERSLDEIVQKYSPKHAAGIIMDPKTGAIVALGMRPGFDPNIYNTVENPAVFTNTAVENLYELGSIMKPLTVAAGIDVGAITRNTTYEDRGSIMKSGKKISNFDGKGRGVVPMQEVLSQSLNTGVSFIVDRMGHDIFGEYMRRYGLGEETGIDLPNEVAGNLAAIERGGSDVDFASASFGQGIAVTPIAMIRALGVLANDGVLPEPHLVRAIRYPSGYEREVPREAKTRVLKSETAAAVSDMLAKVYDEALLDGALRQARYSIAAKTGTAQIALRECGGYCEGRFLHSFFGYFPAHEARYIVLLYAVEPQREQYASATLARPFLDIAKFLINYYDIPPDR